MCINKLSLYSKINRAINKRKTADTHHPQSPPSAGFLNVGLKTSYSTYSNTIERLQKRKNAVNHGIKSSNNNTPLRILI